MQISLVQYSPAWEDKEKNKEKLIQMLQSLSKTDLLLFPEMSLTGFTMKSNQFFEDLKGDSYNYFSSVAVSLNSYVIAGIIEKDGDNYFNTMLVINREGSLISKYRKIHPFSYSSENLHYTAGDAPVIIDIEGWRTGLSICYDLRFPELYRHYGKNETELMINIANWPDTRIHHWSALLKARAIENQCYVAAVNRVGNDPRLHYPGASVIIDPMGLEVIYAAGDEKIISGKISKEDVSEVRKKFPFLKDIHLI